MAGIEKVCEFSGEYPSWDMYRYKRNHIQIMPKYRKLFRGKKAHIEIVSIEKVIKLKYGTMSPPSKYYDEDDRIWWENRMQEGRIMNEYTFKLKMSDPEVFGEVDGEDVDVQLPFKDLEIEISYGERYKSSKDAIVYLLEEAGYKVIFL